MGALLRNNWLAIALFFVAAAMNSLQGWVPALLFLTVAIAVALYANWRSARYLLLPVLVSITVILVAATAVAVTVEVRLPFFPMTTYELFALGLAFFVMVWLYYSYTRTTQSRRGAPKTETKTETPVTTDPNLIKRSQWWNELINEASASGSPFFVFDKGVDYSHVLDPDPFLIFWFDMVSYCPLPVDVGKAVSKKVQYGKAGEKLKQFVQSPSLSSLHEPKTLSARIWLDDHFPAIRLGYECRLVLQQGIPVGFDQYLSGFIPGSKVQYDFGSLEVSVQSYFPDGTTGPHWILKLPLMEF